MPRGKRTQPPYDADAGDGTKGTIGTGVTDYRHDQKRRHLPPAAIAGQGRIQERPRTQYAYNPHLPPVLRFDPDGAPDALPDLLAEAQRRPLTAEEARLLADALRHQEPWLEWAGKREQRGFAVDPVALHVHERVSAQAIVKLAMRQPLQRGLFADPELDYREAVRFYQHDVAWANRLILGDSLTVMESLARREDLAGKVQMIYMDPPYGIKFASNFQAQIGKRDVKDKPEDLTREPEQVKAYRDTWTLGVHSYLSYLRDRLILCRELLADTGSIFVQIGDENLHRVRMLMDDVFGAGNFVVTISVKKKGATTPTDPVNDYLLWFAKERARLPSRRIYAERSSPDDDPKFNTLVSPEGDLVRVVGSQEGKPVAGSSSNAWARVNYPLVSQDPSPRSRDFRWNGKAFKCGQARHWTYDPDADMPRLARAGRLFDGGGESLGGVVMWSDWPYVALSNL